MSPLSALLPLPGVRERSVIYSDVRILLVARQMGEFVTRLKRGGGNWRHDMSICHQAYHPRSS
jgi:hypothetical protein